MSSSDAFGQYGRFWRDSNKALGLSRVAMATRQATIVSARIGRAPDLESGDQSQRRRVLDALVRRAVFTEADRVVREDVDHALLHQRRHADRVAAVVAERQEGAAVRNEAAVQRQAVHHRGHAELAHAVVDVAAVVGRAVFGKSQRRRARRLRQVRAGQVGRAAEQLGQCAREAPRAPVLAGLARGHGLGLWLRVGQRLRGDMCQ